jgi:small subunit ribosomal protein S17
MKKTSSKTEQKEVVASSAKTFKGKVASTKMKDTIVVVVERFVKHPQYGKFIKMRKRLKAHDVGNTAIVGETVTIQETRPISKDKRFILVK